MYHHYHHYSHFRFISIVASYYYLLSFFNVSGSVSSDTDFDDLLWDDPNAMMLEPGDLTSMMTTTTTTTTTPPSIFDDDDDYLKGSGLEFPNSNSDDYSADWMLPFDDIPDGDGDDQNFLFANTPSQSACAAAAVGDDTVFSEFPTLQARDGPPSSCPSPDQQGSSSSSSSSSGILSPETVQLFQDPNTFIDNLIPPPSQPPPSGKKQRPAFGTQNPPGDESGWAVNDMQGIWLDDGVFFCTDAKRKVLVSAEVFDEVC